MIEVSDERFDELVDAALDTIPQEIQDQVCNVALIIEDVHPAGAHILGLYHGVALTRRPHNMAAKLPDTITLYRNSIKRVCHTEEQLQERVRKVVLHEIGHYFGLSDADLHKFGY